LWNKCNTCHIYESQTLLLFLGSSYLCEICYANRKDPTWNKAKTWALRFKIREDSNLSDEERQAQKEYEIEKEFIAAKIRDEIKNAKPLDKSYWANTYDPNKPRAGDYNPNRKKK